MPNLYKPQQTISIFHPLIRGAYMKKDVRAGRNIQDVLVLDAYCEEDSDKSGDTFDSHLEDLLLDLHTLKKEAEAKVGTIDRVDIKVH